MLLGVTAGNDARWVERLRELHLLTPIRVLIILIAAWLISLVVTHVVTRFVHGLQRAQDRVINRADADRLEQRRKTLITVMRSTIVALVWITALITVIGELGINLGAFVATATIIGGALAFGAQTLVRDLIAGFFLIAENQFGVGDTVDAGAATGTVEKVSLRITRLRDEEGRVWYLPNGQITRIANLSQADRVVQVDVIAASDDDLVAVATRLERLANSLSQDDTLVAHLAGEARCLGVEELLADKAALRVCIPCRAGSQNLVRRAFLGAVAEAERRGALHGLATDPEEFEPGASTPDGGAADAFGGTA